MVSRLLASIGIAVVLLVAIVLTASRFVVPDVTHRKGWVLPSRSTEQRPITVSIDSGPSATPLQGMRGRLFVGAERYYFQPDGSGDFFRVYGNTDPFERLYEKLVAKPQRDAGREDQIPRTRQRDHLCLSVLLTGSVEVVPAERDKELRVGRVLAIDLLEVPANDCLRWPYIE